MLHPSKKLLLALEAVLFIAYNGHSDPVSSKQLAAQLGFPVRYLESIMQKLVHEGILRGVRGPRGGYVLARERRRVSIGDVAHIITDTQSDDEHMPQCGSNLGRGVLQPALDEATRVLLDRLHGITLEQLCKDARAKNIALAGKDESDFVI